MLTAVKKLIFATEMQLDNKNEWFASWFDSPYYHLLYQNRDEHEAEDFLTRLMKHLALPTTAHLLDLACGAGRHSRVLQRLGFKVSGCDLSQNSIREATEKAAPGMTFFVHDMRNPLPERYDAVLNLFTSFGYFNDLSDNEKVLKSVAESLPPGGILVIDFMNAEKVIRELKTRQEILRGDVLFHIKKEVAGGKIVKTIAFEADDQSHFFQEKVQALQAADFETLLENTGFIITEIFGSYTLAPFSSHDSDRLILVCRKQ